jgi:transcriptional regulator with XRE-family HTH domain
LVNGGGYDLIKKLNELRFNHNLTQEDVANVLGVARTTYAMYEQGKREMDYNLLINLADYYKVSIDYLLGRSEIPIHPESYTDDEIEFMIKSLALYKEMKQKINL